MITSTSSLGLDLIEGTTITVKSGLLTGQRLPAQDRHIDILRIKFQAVADALGQCGSRKGSSAPKKRLINQGTAAGVVQNGAPDQLYWFLRWMWSNLSSSEPPMMNPCGEGRYPDGGVLSGFSKPRGILLPDVPNWLVGEPIMGARQHVILSEELHNSGSEPVVPKGVVVILNASGKRVAKAVFKIQRLLPGERLIFAATNPAQLAPGHYRTLSSFEFEGKVLTSAGEFTIPD